MKVKTFFYLALALPFIGAVLSFPLMFLIDIFAIPVAAIWLAGIPYGTFAALMIILMRNIEDIRKLHVLAWTAPAFFLPVYAAYWLITSYIDSGQFPGLETFFEFLPIMSMLVLALGYVYVAIFTVLYLLIPFTDLHRHRPDHNNGFNRTPEGSGPAKPGDFGGGAG